jgi:hypothetical protein
MYRHNVFRLSRSLYWLLARKKRFHETLTRWMEIAPAKVINRCAPMATNSSKPNQTQLVRKAGFLIPETLITNDPELVRELCARYGHAAHCADTDDSELYTSHRSSP